MSHLLLHPEQEVPPLLPEPVDGAPGVDVALAGRLQPGQVRVLLTHGAAQGFLPGDHYFLLNWNKIFVKIVRKVN